MTAELISGTEISKAILEEIKQEVAEMKEKSGKVPGLVTILVGENPASISYVTLKVKTALNLGFKEIQDNQPEDISEEDLLALIDKYNSDDTIHGILVQLPLPEHIDSTLVMEAIHPDKDVDGFHPINVGRLAMKGRDPQFIPAAPYGCMYLLREAEKLVDGFQIEGSNAVVLGRSNIVGMPMALLLIHANATVTVVHSRTKDIPSIVQNADILIGAMGRPEMIKGDMDKHRWEMKCCGA